MQYHYNKLDHGELYTCRHKFYIEKKTYKEYVTKYVNEIMQNKLTVMHVSM